MGIVGVGLQLTAGIRGAGVCLARHVHGVLVHGHPVIMTPVMRHLHHLQRTRSDFLLLVQGNGGFLSGFVGALWPMADGPANGAAGHFTDGPRPDAGLRGIGDASPLLMPGVRRPSLLWEPYRMLPYGICLQDPWRCHVPPPLALVWAGRHRDGTSTPHLALTALTKLLIAAPQITAYIRP